MQGDRDLARVDTMFLDRPARSNHTVPSGRARFSYAFQALRARLPSLLRDGSLRGYNPRHFMPGYLHSVTPGQSVAADAKIKLALMGFSSGSGSEMRIAL